MTTTRTWGALVAILAIATGCGGGEMMSPDAGPGGDSGPGDSGLRPDTGMMMTGDGNDSFADADPITLTETTSDSIRTPGDLDYFSFTGTAGQWIAINTTANPDDDPAMVDTVVTLFDSSMTQIAENDDAFPRANTDSEIIIRLPADGTYYLLVQEWSTWAGEPDEGMASFTYDLDVNELAEVSGGAINLDHEGGDDLASAQALMFRSVTGGDVAFLMGTANDGTDVDVYSFSVVAGRPNIQFTIMPAGTDGYGSTGQPARLWITNAAGDQVIARIATSALDELNPSLPAGDYLLWVDSPASLGSNPFYVIKGFKAGDNPAEAADVTNDVAVTPEAITFAAGAEPMTRVGYILAQLGTTDTDFYSIDVMAGEQVSVYCGSRTSGSGVVDLQAAVLDATGTTTLGMATETAAMPIAIADLAVPAAGTYLVRLTKASQDAVVTGEWVRCGIVLAPPAAP